MGRIQTTDLHTYLFATERFGHNKISSVGGLLTRSRCPVTVTQWQLRRNTTRPPIFTRALALPGVLRTKSRREPASPLFLTTGLLWLSATTTFPATRTCTHGREVLGACNR